MGGRRGAQRRAHPGVLLLLSLAVGWAARPAGAVAPRRLLGGPNQTQGPPTQHGGLPAWSSSRSRSSSSDMERAGLQHHQQQQHQHQHQHQQTVRVLQRVRLLHFESSDGGPSSFEVATDGALARDGWPSAPGPGVAPPLAGTARSSSADNSWGASRGPLAATSSSGGGGGSSVTLDVQFSLEPRADGLALLLPQPLFLLRYMTLEVLEMQDSGPGRSACRRDALAYSSQAVECPDLAPGVYQVTLVDAGDYTVELVTEGGFVRVAAGGRPQRFAVEVGVRAVLAAAVFDSIQWSTDAAARGAPRTRLYPIGNAAVDLYTRADPGLAWSRYSSSPSNGTVLAYLPTGAGSVFFANFTFDGTQLASTGPFGAGVADTTLADAAGGAAASSLGGALPGVHVDLLLVSSRSFLCSGQFLSVRGDAGTFPALPVTNTFFPSSDSFACNWVLMPSSPELSMVINYTMMLPGEELWVVPSDDPQQLLLLSARDDFGGVVERTMMVSSMGVQFQFHPGTSPDFRVGGFQVTFRSSDPWQSRLLSSKTLLVVLTLIVGLAALLVACCVCCACVNRRARAQVQISDGGAPTANLVALGLTRVPTPVRRLLPVKPYVSPDPKNPLPGAPVEPDCCSICLVEFSEGEDVLVLPCSHFYHAPCIDGWLKRRCTCPLCKGNVLEALQPRPAVQGQRAGGAAAAAAAAPGMMDDARVQVELLPPALRASIMPLGPQPTWRPRLDATAAAAAAAAEAPSVPRLSQSAAQQPAPEPAEGLLQQPWAAPPGVVVSAGSRAGSEPGDAPEPPGTFGAEQRAALCDVERPSAARPALQQGYARTTAEDFAAAAAAIQDALAAAEGEDGEQQQPQQPQQPGAARGAAALGGILRLPPLPHVVRAPSARLQAVGQRLRQALQPSSDAAGAAAGGGGPGDDAGASSGDAAGALELPARGQGQQQPLPPCPPPPPSAAAAAGAPLPVVLQSGQTVLPVYAYAGVLEPLAHERVSHGGC